MGTCCIIRVEGLEHIGLYKHFDGYPEGTLNWLMDFNEDFTKNRGNDKSYKLAQLIRSSAFDCEKYNLDSSRYTGWGIAHKNHGRLYEYTEDFQYLYTLMTDGTVSVKMKKEVLRGEIF